MLPTLALILAKLKSKFFGINSSIALANKIGEKAFIEKLWDKLNQLKEIELVLEKKYLNGIVSFNIENIEDKEKFVKKLGEKKIWIRVLEDPKWFRACVHQMTTEVEIDLLSKEIKKILT